MNRRCKIKCIDEEKCEIVQKERYKNLYCEYSKINNNSNLRIQKLHELQYTKERLILEKNNYKNPLIDRVISLTTLVVTSCSIIIDKSVYITIILLILISFYIIYCIWKENSDKKKYKELSLKINDINFKLRVIKDLIYNQDKIYV